jgi:AraC-like DNA-binding protein
VSQAADMLRESDRKILDIAMEVGFENASYFIVKFKKYMRCTPHEWLVNQT